MIVQKVARYEVVEPLGSGPHGTVYRAYDHEHAREVALRVMPPEVVRWDADLRTRFRNEGLAISALKHPNIAEWYEIGQHDESMYIAAELVPGRDLRRFIGEDVALAIEKRIGVMHQVSAALAHAHQAGILHRDIRPANIFLQPDGVAKVADFGLASMTAGSLTKATVRWGGPLYLCPEQIRQKSYDTRSEIFALGSVFYEFLTGIHPFQHCNSNRVLDEIVSEERLPSFEPLFDAPAGLCSVLARCLAKDPAERFESMSELADTLGELIEDISKECQAMLVELQIATHRLKRAAAVPDAPPELAELARNIRNLLTSDHRRDYASLDALMSALAEQSAVIHVLTKGPSRRHIPPRPVPAPAAQEAAADYNAPALAAPSSATAVAEPVCVPVVSEAPEPTVAPLPGVEETRQESLESLDAGELEFLQVMMAESCDSHGVVQVPGPEVPFETESQALVLCPTVSPDALPRRRHVRTRVLAGVVAICATAAVLAFGWQHRAALSGLVRSGLRKLPGRSMPAAPKPAGASTAQPAASYEPAADVLVREAQLMLARGRPDASRVFIQRALDLDPGNKAALTLLTDLEAKTAAVPVAEDPLRDQVSAAAGLIAGGQLRKARLEIERIAAANPEHASLPGLRKSLEAKSAEAGRDAARKKAEQAETARRALADESWSKRGAELFRSGKYSELARALDQWGVENPASTQLATLRGQAAQVQQLLGVYQSAMTDKRYTDASVALSRAEALNPSDPALPELRRFLEAKRAGARARLTVLRLTEPGVILLDAVPLGHGGEVQGAPVAIGEHVLSVKLPGLPAYTVAHDFSDGENISFVYDSHALRITGAADLEAAATRKTREEMHRFVVEHPHGLLRGSCKGELLINGFDVVYKPQTGSHGFQVPFARLIMKSEGRVVEFRFASDDTELQSFRIRDAGEADSLRQLWAKLRKDSQ